MLESGGQVKSIAHEERRALIAVLTDAPQTGAMVAKRLGLPVARVHYHLQRLPRTGANPGDRARPAAGGSHAARSVFPNALQSGLINCEACGASVILADGSVKSRTARYGCSWNRRRGTCDNAARVAKRLLDDRVLDLLTSTVMQPEFMAEAVEAIQKAYAAAAAAARRDHDGHVAQRQEARKQLSRSWRRWPRPRPRPSRSSGRSPRRRPRSSASTNGSRRTLAPPER